MLNQELKKQCVIVLGSGRSGTSAMTGTLAKLGVDLGTNLKRPSSHNEKGYWEHEDVRKLTRRIMRGAGGYLFSYGTVPEAQWASNAIRQYQQDILTVLKRDFDESPLWCIKHPAIGPLLSLWHPILAEIGASPRFVVMFRNPIEVFKSRRPALDKSQFYQQMVMWSAQNVYSERYSRGCSRVFVSYSELIADWRGTIVKISDCLDLRWPRKMEDAESDIDDFLQPSLRHYDVPEKDFFQHPRIPQATKDVYTGLQEFVVRSSRHLEKGTQLAFERVAEAVDDLVFKELVTELAHLKNSKSWRITAPLRKCYRLLRSLRAAEKSG
jgi:hypothetical protein